MKKVLITNTQTYRNESMMSLNVMKNWELLVHDITPISKSQNVNVSSRLQMKKQEGLI